MCSSPPSPIQPYTEVIAEPTQRSLNSEKNLGGSEGINQRSNDETQPPGLRDQISSRLPHQNETQLSDKDLVESVDDSPKRQKTPIATSAPPLTSDSGNRMLKLMCYPSRPFKAHWAFWLPSITDPALGKVVHVTGDVRNGFDFEIKRNYDHEDSARTSQVYDIGQMSAQDLKDTPLNNHAIFETTPRDNFEQVAISVAPPGPSLRSAGVNRGIPSERVELHDCQWWIYQVVGVLVDRGMIDASAIDALNAAPMTWLAIARREVAGTGMQSQHRLVHAWLRPGVIVGQEVQCLSPLKE